MTSRTKGVLLLGDPQLREVSKEVVKTDFKNEEFLEKVKLLQHTLREFRKNVGFGRAIAAPQIGVSKRFVAFHLEKEFVMFNPVIIWKSDEMKTMFDDCMSFPDLMVKLKRHRSISVEYYNNRFEKIVLEKLDFTKSELMQHEFDHLDGVLAIDRAIPGKDSIIYREIYERFFKK